jgi:hypothetical protein
MVFGISIKVLKLDIKKSLILFSIDHQTAWENPTMRPWAKQCSRHGESMCCPSGLLTCAPQLFPARILRFQLTGKSAFYDGTELPLFDR